jgi:hypothetical protein
MTRILNWAKNQRMTLLLILHKMSHLLNTNYACGKRKTKPKIADRPRCVIVDSVVVKLIQYINIYNRFLNYLRMCREESEVNLFPHPQLKHAL